MPVKLGELLLKENMVTPQQLQEALSYQKRNGGKLGKSFVTLGYVRDEFAQRGGDPETVRGYRGGYLSHYPSRSATIGSTLAARRAGTRQATSATRPSKAAAAPTVTG